jgi:hypothetical protein
VELGIWGTGLGISIQENSETYLVQDRRFLFYTDEIGDVVEVRWQ